MQKIYRILALLLTSIYCQAQTIDPWTISAKNWDTKNYYGATVANGMIGVVSSQDPFKVKDVIFVYIGVRFRGAS